MGNIALIAPSRKHISALTAALETVGHTVCWLGEEPLAIKRTDNFDLLILSPDQTRGGIDLCRELRKIGIDTPLMLIAVRQDYSDMIWAYKAGVDGYISRPYTMEELHTRISSLLIRPPRTISKQVVKVGSLSVDKSNYIAALNGKQIKLRRREFAILALLLENRNSVFSRESINKKTTSARKECEDYAIDVHVSNIRKALKPYALSDAIETVHGIGYRFREVPALADQQN